MPSTPNALKPFQQEESEKFIDNELKKRLKMNIISTTKPILIFEGDRSLTTKANDLAKHVIESKKFPMFFLLTTQYAIVASKFNADKHATVIAITKNISKDDKQYNIYLFDPNGPLDVKTIRHDLNVHTLLTKLSLILNTEVKSEDKGKYCELMCLDNKGKSRGSINSLYGGYCDALSLWFIYINRESKTKENIINKFKEFYESMDPENIKKETANILENLRKLGKR